MVAIPFLFVCSTLIVLLPRLYWNYSTCMILITLALAVLQLCWSYYRRVAVRIYHTECGVPWNFPPKAQVSPSSSVKVILAYMSYYFSYPNSTRSTSLVSRPKAPCGEEGLVTFERFLGYAHRYVIVFQKVLRNAYGICAYTCMGITSVARIQARIPAI